jgi:hypothetical protein
VDAVDLAGIDLERFADAEPVARPGLHPAAPQAPRE